MKGRTGLGTFENALTLFNKKAFAVGSKCCYIEKVQYIILRISRYTLSGFTWKLLRRKHFCGVKRVHYITLKGYPVWCGVVDRVMY